MLIMEAGHSLAHKPQPIHLLSSTRAYLPLYMDMAPLGQTFMHEPHATHKSLVTLANLFDIIFTALRII